MNFDFLESKSIWKKQFRQMLSRIEILLFAFWNNSGHCRYKKSRRKKGFSEASIKVLLQCKIQGSAMCKTVWEIWTHSRKHSLYTVCIKNRVFLSWHGWADMATVNIIWLNFYFYKFSFESLFAWLLSLLIWRLEKCKLNIFFWMSLTFEYNLQKFYVKCFHSIT